MKRYRWSVWCVAVCCVVFGACGDDGGDGGSDGGDSTTSASTSGTSNDTSGGGGGGGATSASETTAQGLPRGGSTPRETWCQDDVIGPCVDQFRWEEWQRFYGSQVTEEQTQDWCGCQLSLRQCEGAPWSITDFEDPLYDECAEHTNAFSLP